MESEFVSWVWLVDVEVHSILYYGLFGKSRVIGPSGACRQRWMLFFGGGFSVCEMALFLWKEFVDVKLGDIIHNWELL